MQPCPACGITTLFQVGPDGQLLELPGAHCCPYHAGLADQDILEALQILKRARELKALADQAMDNLRTAWEQQPDVQAIKKTLEAAKMDVDTWDGFIRRRAIQAFKETGEKHYQGGVNVQEKVKVEYDSDKALQWARQANIALKLDDKTFQKIARSTQPGQMPFVVLSTVPEATIPQVIK